MPQSAACHPFGASIFVTACRTFVARLSLFCSQTTATALTSSCWGSKRKISSAATPPRCASTPRGSATAPTTAATTPTRPTARVSVRSEDAQTQKPVLFFRKRDLRPGRYEHLAAGCVASLQLVSHGQKCEEGHFACPSGNCISSVWLCDGQKDCEDGADEFQCGK